MDQTAERISVMVRNGMGSETSSWWWVLQLRRPGKEGLYPLVGMVGFLFVVISGFVVRLLWVPIGDG